MGLLDKEVQRHLFDFPKCNGTVVLVAETVDTNHASHQQIISVGAQTHSSPAWLTAEQVFLSLVVHATSTWPVLRPNVRLNESMLAQAKRMLRLESARLEVLERVIGREAESIPSC